jgi:hypothetical protein
LTGLFPPLPEETRHILDYLPELIDKVFPLPARFRQGLPKDVAELSRLLTSGREDRSGSYLGKPALLSAYLRYFLPWNIYRLSRLFAALPLRLKPNDAVNDFGAGPLTLAVSLWISRPDLRNIPLEFRCLDRTAAVLEAGKKLFAALTTTWPAENSHESGQASGCPWTLKTIRGELRTFGTRRSGVLSVELRGKPAVLSAAVNVYNELFWDISPHVYSTEGSSPDISRFGRFAESHVRFLSSLTENSGSVLIVEPGIPRSGEFISLLRSFFLEEGRPPLSPCTHPGPCPLKKSKWCHFSFDTEDAPEALHKLSEAAHLPKERAVLSFLLAGPVQQQNTENKEQHTSRPVNIRIISDSFPLDGKTHGKKEMNTGSWGRYGCSEAGLVLVTGSRKALETSPSGALEKTPLLKGSIDAKSGALVAAKK